ncbi:MAG TPA: 3-oxoacyl-[acyl-carrier-protein] synthase III C-terminal domain-containing protein [Burkholderiales bacterium]|jgi:alkylresorcinol/alkylpyrone synthase
MFIHAVGTAVPERRYSQLEGWEALRASRRYEALGAPARALLQRVLCGDSGVQTRHLALDSLAEAFEIDPDVLHARFRRHAPALAVQASHKALDRAGLEPHEVDALLISTCTGYLCPGLTSHVGEQLGLRDDVIALDLVGQGCGAALPNLRTGDALIAARRAGKVLSVCVEVCSAAMYLDQDPGVLVSACLFGDGAAAAVLSAEPGERSVQWIDGASLHEPVERDALRMEQRGGLLRNILSKRVPRLAAQYAQRVFRTVSERHHPEEISTWVWHAGGRPVLDNVRDTMGLRESEMARSRDLLARFGNLSSPFVLFVLEAALREKAPGGWWWMSSFGAGFSCHGALLKVA